MANIWRNAIRTPAETGSGGWRRRVQYNTPVVAGDPAGAIPLAKLERGSVVTSCRAFKATALAGTSPTFTVGTVANPSALMSNTDTAPGSTGYSAVGTGSALGQELAADTQFFVFFGGTGLTAGDIDVHLHFLNPRNWSDLQGNQAS